MKLDLVSNSLNHLSVKLDIGKSWQVSIDPAYSLLGEENLTKIYSWKAGKMWHTHCFSPCYYTVSAFSLHRGLFKDFVPVLSCQKHVFSKHV